MLGKYSKESNWTYQKVLCLPGQPAHRASMFCGTFLSPDLSLSKLEGSSSTQWYRLCFNGNWDHHLYRGWFMPLSFSNREWGCSLDVYLLLRAVNLSQIPQYSHNEVLIILVRVVVILWYSQSFISQPHLMPSWFLKGSAKPQYVA